MEAFFTSLAAYILVALASAFILPFFIAPPTLLGWIRGSNHFETSRRDRLFLPLTKLLAKTRLHPNTITLGGMLLVFLLAAGFISRAAPTQLFFIALLASLSDLFDGMLARASDQVTVLGGILDNTRDAMLFAVITVGLLTQGLMPQKFFIWFVVGAAIGEGMKLLEGRRRHMGTSIPNSFRNKFSGEDKLAIDRTRFFFYLASCLGFLLAARSPGLTSAAEALLWIAIATTFLSVAAHAILYRFGARVIAQ